MADDFMVVYRDILPGLNAPPEVRALFRTILVDWINLDTLAGFEVNHDVVDVEWHAEEATWNESYRVDWTKMRQPSEPS